MIASRTFSDNRCGPGGQQYITSQPEVPFGLHGAEMLVFTTSSYGSQSSSNPGTSVLRITVQARGKAKRKRPTQPESTTLLGTGSKQGTAKSKQKSNQARERRFLILAAKLGFFSLHSPLPQSAEPPKRTAPC
ncbi:predicted protein [Histoplasma capsulatum H143]|uniref:Uncharacterized protein n=1 Tax=Ajellomyces capsulatus (strain H143) TaxID=544712 RepID=C6HSW9_AJECH|nr:predicted protein [Histoplasma capsulatum H143]